MTKRYTEMMSTADDMVWEAQRLEQAADDLMARARKMYPWHGPRKPPARLLEDYTLQLKADLSRKFFE